MVHNLLRQLDWPIPDFSTVCRHQKTLQVELSYQRAKSPLQLQLQLQLLVDSTGIKFLGEGEWKRKKHGAEYRREWRKAHLGIDVQTLEIHAIEVTSNAIGDAPMQPELLAQIPTDEPIESVCADGAYDTRDCQDGIAERHALAVAPPRRNARHWRTSSAGAAQRNEAIRACQRLGRSIWKKCSGYHRRSLVETKMHCFRRLGERVSARAFDRQVVELHVRVALLNRFSQIGRPHTVPVAAVAYVRLGLGVMPSETRFVQKSLRQRSWISSKATSQERFDITCGKCNNTCVM